MTDLTEGTQYPQVSLLSKYHGSIVNLQCVCVCVRVHVCVLCACVCVCVCVCACMRVRALCV